MADVTLATINQTLVSVDDNTQKTSRGIEGFLKYLEEKRRDDLEAEREKQAQRVEVNKTKSDSTGKSSGGGGGFKLPSLKGLGGLATVGGAVALAKTLGSRLVKRGLFAAVATAFADDIAAALVKGDDQPSEQLRNTLSNAISGGAIGYAVAGKKGGLIGILSGALLTNPKTKEALKKLGTNLEETATKIFGDVDVKGTLANASNTMSGLLGKGITSMNNLLEGNTDNLASDIAGSLTTLAGLAFLVSPRATIGAGKSTLRGLLKGFSKSGPIGKKVAGILALLGLTAISPSGAVQGMGLDQEGGVGDGLENVDTSNMSTSQLRKMQEKRNENLAIVDDTVGKTGLATAGTAIASSKLAEQYMKNRTVKRPVRLTGNYGASNLDAGGQKTLDNYKRLKKVLNFAKGAGFGLVAAALELPEVLDIINNPNLSDKQKAILMGPILGRSIGAAGFAAFGSAVGLASPIPGGALIGGGALGYLGYISGDRAGEFLADFLLGGSPKLGPEEAKIAKTFMEDKLRKMAGGQNYGDTVRATSIFDRTLPQDINLAGTGLGVQKRLTGSNYQDLVSSLGSINAGMNNLPKSPATGTPPAYVFNDNGTRVTNNQAALFDGGPIINMQDQFAGGT